MSQVINNKIIGERLAMARARTGAKSARQFAIKADIDDSQYIKVENGDKGLGWESLMELCSVWGINLDWVLTGNGRMLLKDPDPMETTLPLGDIKVTVADYINLLQQYNEQLKNQLNPNSARIDVELAEIMRTMRTDHAELKKGIQELWGKVSEKPPKG